MPLHLGDIHVNTGYVYVLSNTYVPELVKIGYTLRSPEDRATELSNFTGVPGKWSICKSWRINDAAQWERRIFRSLHQYRETGEFFKLSPDKAIELISVLLNLAGAIDVEGRSAADLYEIEKAKLANKNFFVAEGSRIVREEWDRIKSKEHDAALCQAEREFGKSLNEINRDKYGFSSLLIRTLINLFCISLLAFAVIFFPYFVAYFISCFIAMYLLALFGGEGLLDKISRTKIWKWRDPRDIDREKLFSIRDRILTQARRNFFQSRGVSYPFDD
jgi:hypothetical protein